jgi:hypothetical protein
MTKIKKSLKIFIIILIAFFVLLTPVFCYFYVGKATEAKNITWGVDFSQMQTEVLGLNWKETYLAVLNDLGAKNIKLHTQWDWVEGIKDDYYFDDIDWQIKKAEEKNAKIIFVVGIKTGRWPECHIPAWVNNLSKEQQQEQVLEYINEVVLRYKDSKAVSYWQVENEPFFKFGKCPSWYYKDKEFLKKEIALVKSLDADRKIIVSDSGEQSMWFGAAKTGDIVGTTMYKKVWFHITDKIGFNMDFLLPSVNYARRAEIIKKLYNKDVICIELQAEPWTRTPYVDATIEEQAKTMNLDIFKKNIEYAKSTGLDTFYLWGVEWWYWMKTTQNQPEIWNEAKQLFVK